jgi:S-adenosyl-L-methionine hydrolase (adenosine-forming)
VAARPITFLSDYGYEDEFAGVCRAVIARIAPDALVIDLTHGIERHAVERGAQVLANALPYTPAGVHLAVVDPGVGSPRRALAVRTATEDRVLVGPDNGLLWPAIEQLGGALEAVDASLSRFRLEPISATFHGRDVFAPVAAHLARGASLVDAGEAIDTGSLVRLEAPEPVIEADRVCAHVVSVDRFGNAALDLADRHLPESGLRLGRKLTIEAGGTAHDAVFTLTFADVPDGGLILYEDSYGSLAVALNRGDAARDLRLEPGSEVVLRPVG